MQFWSRTTITQHKKDIYARIKSVDSSVSFAKVYHAVPTLGDENVDQHVELNHGPAHFEIAPKTEYDHLVNLDNGEALELAFDNLIALRSRLIAELGYDILI